MRKGKRPRRTTARTVTPTIRGTLGLVEAAERGREVPVGSGPLKKLKGPVPVGKVPDRTAGSSVMSVGFPDELLVNIINDP